MDWRPLLLNSPLVSNGIFSSLGQVDDAFEKGQVFQLTFASKRPFRERKKRGNHGDCQHTKNTHFWCILGIFMLWSALGRFIPTSESFGRKSLALALRKMRWRISNKEPSNASKVERCAKHLYLSLSAVSVRNVCFVFASRSNGSFSEGCERNSRRFSYSLAQLNILAKKFSAKKRKERQGYRLYHALMLHSSKVNPWLKHGMSEHHSEKVLRRTQKRWDITKAFIGIVLISLYLPMYRSEGALKDLMTFVSLECAKTLPQTVEK